MSDLSTALRGLAEVMNNVQANRKVYRLSGLGIKAIDGSGKHPSEVIWVSNAELCIGGGLNLGEIAGIIIDFKTIQEANLYCCMFMPGRCNQLA